MYLHLLLLLFILICIFYHNRCEHYSFLGDRAMNDTSAYDNLVKYGHLSYVIGDGDSVNIDGLLNNYKKQCNYDQNFDITKKDADCISKLIDDCQKERPDEAELCWYL